MLASPTTTPLDVVNLALGLLGEEARTSLGDGSAAGNVASRIYELRVRACLSAARWRFAMRQVKLVRLAGTPLEVYSAVYQTPTDAVMVHSISVAGSETPFDVFGDQLFCSAGENDDVIADYAIRPSEDKWPALFTAYVAETMAADFALGAIGQAEVGTFWRQSADARRRIAAAQEAQNRTPARVDTGAFLRARRG